MADPAPNLAVDRQRRALEAIYRQAEAELSLLVAESLRSGNLGTSSYRQRQLVAVRTILERANAEGIAAATGLIATGYVQGGQLVDALTGNLPRAASFSGVHQAAVELLADNMAGSLGDAGRTVGRRIEDIFRREGLAAVAQGLAQGSARAEVTDRLVESLTRDGVTGFVDRAGRRWGLETYATMAARTTTREAVSIGTTNRLLETGQDAVRISSHPHDPDVCTPYDGGTFSLTGATPGLERLDRLPPFHPNCRHVVAPGAVDIDEVIAHLDSAETWAEAETAVGRGVTSPPPGPPLSVEAGAR